MAKYTISKKGENKDNPFSHLSHFGDTAKEFTGNSEQGPVIGERFILKDSYGRIVIDTSPIVEVSDTEIKTVYSIYSINKL